MKHSCTSLVCVMVVICMVLISASAQTAVVTYTDRSSWVAAVGTYSEEDFDTYEMDTDFHGGPQVNFYPFALYANYHWNSDPHGNFIDTSPFLYDYDNETPYASMYTDEKGTDFTIYVVLSSSGYGDTFSSWGADFYEAPLDGEELELVLKRSNDYVEVGRETVTVNTGFFGFTSDYELWDIEFRSKYNESGGESFGMDNVVWGGAPVPIPGTLLLLGAGLIGLAALRRKVR